MFVVSRHGIHILLSCVIIITPTQVLVFSVNLDSFSGWQTGRVKELDPCVRMVTCVGKKWKARTRLMPVGNGVRKSLSLVTLRPISRSFKWPSAKNSSFPICEALSLGRRTRIQDWRKTTLPEKKHNGWVILHEWTLAKIREAIKRMRQLVYQDAANILPWYVSSLYFSVIVFPVQPLLTISISSSDAMCLSFSSNLSRSSIGENVLEKDPWVIDEATKSFVPFRSYTFTLFPLYRTYFIWCYPEVGFQQEMKAELLVHQCDGCSVRKYVTTCLCCVLSK